MSNRPLAVPKSRLPAGGAKSPTTTARTTPLDQPLSYEEREIRNRAARVLENEEMLLLLSRQRHESVLQTRIYCEARAAGLKDETLKFDYTMDLSEEKDSTKSGMKSPAAKGTARVASGSSKNPGSPSNSKRDKDRGREGGRMSLGSTR